MNRSEIVGGLWVGAHPEDNLEGFSLLVLAAFQLQDAAEFRGVRVHRAPLTDDAFRIVKGDEQRASYAAVVVATEVKRGGKALVVCKEGLNRSAWVAALALIALGYSRSDAFETVRFRRAGSLYNWFFQQHVLGRSTAR